MKRRNSFVTNSSSSSYIIVTLGDKEIHSHGDTDMECCNGSSMLIDDLMKELIEAKSKGIVRIDFDSGGGYEG